MENHNFLEATYASRGRLLPPLLLLLVVALWSVAGRLWLVGWLWSDGDGGVDDG